MSGVFRQQAKIVFSQNQTLHSWLSWSGLKKDVYVGCPEFLGMVTDLLEWRKNHQGKTRKIF